MRDITIEDSFICYNWFPLVADHCMDQSSVNFAGCGVSRLHNYDHLDPKEVEYGDIVFVNIYYLKNGHFQEHVLPQIENRFILVSGIGGYQIGSFGDKSYMKILESPNLIKWFCTNPPNVKSDKIIPLPIGFQERERAGGNQKLIEEIFNNKCEFAKKKDKILLPYHRDTNPNRQKVFEALSALPFVETCSQRLPWEDYMKLLNEYKFTICLEGIAPDVHRNYECLLVNSIPINIKNIIEGLFKYHKLPGIFFVSWANLTENSFKESYKNDYNFNNVEKFLKIKYHAGLIKKSQREAIDSLPLIVGGGPKSDI